MAKKTAILSVRILSDSKGAVVGLKKTSAAIVGLQRVAASTRGLTAGIFTTIPRLAMMATMLGTIAAVSLSSVGSILTLAASLSSVALAALAVPGLLMGAGAAVAVTAIAFKDAGTYLGDLAPQFSALQGAISPAFWEQAAEPIRALATGVLPVLSENLPKVATAMGQVFASMANAAGGTLGLSQIGVILSYAAEGAQNFAAGAGQLISAILTLGTAGASYLPALGQWFTDIFTRFNAFITAAAADGSLHAWIQNGITGLGLLWDSIVSVTGIFAGLTRAANEAGGAGLAGFAGGLEAINAAVNGAAFQGALVQVFTGANEAVGLLGPGLTALGNAFITLAPTIAAILPLATGAFGAILEGVAAVLSHPAVAGGLISAFEGINTGITALAGIFETLAPLLGAALELFGGLASGVLPLLASVITALAPPITAVVSAIASWVQANPALAAAILAITGVIAALVPVVINIVGFIGTLVTAWGAVTAAVTPVLTGIGTLSTIFSALGLSLTATLAPLLAIGAGIATLAAGLVYALATSEPFRAALVNLGAAFIGLIQPIIGAVMPALQSLGASFMSLLGTVMNALTPMFTAIVEFGGAVLTALAPVAQFIGGVLGPVFSWLADVAGSAMTWLGSIISSAAGLITNIFKALTAALRGDWGEMWSFLGNAVTSGLELIKSVFIGGLQFIGELVWSTTFRIIELFGNLLTSVIDIAGRLFNYIVSAGTEGMVALGNAILRGVDNVVNFFRELPGKVNSALSDWGAKMQTMGSQIIDGLVNGIKGAAGKAVQAVKDTVGSAIDGAKKLLGIKSPSRVFRSIGRFTSEGLAIGVAQMAPKAVRAVETMATRLTAAGAGIQLTTPDVRYRTPAVEPARARAQASTTGTSTAAPSITINLNGVIGDRVAIANEIERLLREKQILMGGI